MNACLRQTMVDAKPLPSGFHLASMTSPCRLTLNMSRMG
jgi:hypothetical protein